MIWKTRDKLNQQNNIRNPIVIYCIDDYLTGKRFPMGMLVNIST